MDFKPEYQIRYALEQRLIPQLLFSEHGMGTVLTILREKGRFFIRCLQELAEQTEPKCGYREEDFDVRPLPFFDEGEKLKFFLMVVDLPEPETMPLSSRLFICCDGKYEKIGYYTVEKSIGADMLCGADGKGNHMNYGPAPKEEKEQIKRVLQLSGFLP